MISESSEQRTQQSDIVLQTTHSCSRHDLSSAILAHPSTNTPHKDAGLNPLVDAAARLFSIVGKLQQLKSCRDPEQLQTDLLAEINTFQETVKNLGYGPETLLVSRYAVCATLDDVITQTAWGTEGQWNDSCQQGLFGSENVQSDRFFLILERIIHDPSQYIDLMEFMYICLSLGFRGNYQSTEFGHHRLEQISDALYRQIRSHHGDFNRTLSPFPVKAPSVTPPPSGQPFSATLVILITASLIMLLFVGLAFTLNAYTEKAHTQLAEIGSTFPHEAIHT